MNRVFVYGTLMSGGHNNYLLRDARLLGRTETSDKFLMHDLGPFPTVTRNPCGIRIQGELWECSDADLEGLDRLEGHPHQYRREPVVLAAGFDRIRAPITLNFAVAWIYVWAGPLPEQPWPIIASGDWRDKIHHYVCTDCNGGGVYDSENCETCNGTGKVTA